MKKNNQYFVLIIFVIFAIIYFCITHYKNKKELNSLTKEYPRITMSDSIDNVVIDKYYPKKWRGRSICQYITLNDNRKFYFFIDRSISDGNYSFGDIVSPGDRLFKRRYSDTLFLYSGSFEYVFTLMINE